MNVGNRFKVESDSLNVTVFEKRTARKTKKEYWKPIAYFSTIHNALDYIVDLEVKETGLKDLKTVVAKQKELYSLIRGVKWQQK